MRNIESTIFISMTGFVIGGIVSSVSSILGFAAVVTAAAAGATRYGAVLAGSDKDGVERATAIGFYLGVAVSILLLLVDRL